MKTLTYFYPFFLNNPGIKGQITPPNKALEIVSDCRFCIHFSKFSDGKSSGVIKFIH